MPVMFAPLSSTEGGEDAGTYVGPGGVHASLILKLIHNPLN